VASSIYLILYHAMDMLGEKFFRLHPVNCNDRVPYRLNLEVAQFAGMVTE
jgi:hypothetical protein